MKIKIAHLFKFCILSFVSQALAQNRLPLIDTLFVQQSATSMNVEINYDVIDLENDKLIVLVKISDDGGETFNIPAISFSGDYGLGILPGASKQIIWYAGTDYPEKYGVNFRAKLIVSDAKINLLASIAEGAFLMGEGAGIDDPVHEIALATYNMCPHAVSNEEYRLFCVDTNHEFPVEGGSFQAPPGYFLNYKQNPVVGVSWYDAVRYCNWLSTLEGLEPCYNVSDWSFHPNKNGYHLPTEAQWEKAARGALTQKIYPWGDDSPDNRCNYTGYIGELLAKQGLMADFNGQGRGPLPVDSLYANYYGLYQMAGNVWEWCTDWYQEDYYFQSPSQNPLGPSTGTEKVLRGGAWNTSEVNLHCAKRYSKSASTKRYDIGFRIAK